MFEIGIKIEKTISRIPLVEISYSKRRKYIHFAFEKVICEFERKDEFFKEVEKFYNKNLEKDFIMIKPMKLINTIRWKSD